MRVNRPEVTTASNPRTPNPVRHDWQLTRVRVERTGSARRAIEGYCSRQSVQAGESLDIMVSTNRRRRVRDRDLPHGLLRRPRRPAHDEARAVGGQGPARSRRRARKNLHECHWEPAASLTIPERLAQRRLSRPAHDARRRRHRALLAELRRLHRPRRPPRRHPVPVLRQHLAGVQPLAEQLSRSTPIPRGAQGPWADVSLRPPLRPRGAVHGVVNDPLSRSARANSCRSSSRWRTGSRSTATTSPTAPTATCSPPTTG